MNFEKRKKELLDKIANAKNEEEVKALEAEVRKLNEEKAAYDKEILEQKRNLANVVAGEGVVIEDSKTLNDKEERKAKLAKILASEEYENAYAEDIKTNKDTQTRALLTDLVEGGTVPVPTYIQDKVSTNWEKNEILNKVSETTFKGVAKYPFERSATDASIHVEGTAAPDEETLLLGTVTANPQSIKKWITISTEAMDLKGREFLDYIYDEIEYKILNKAVKQIIAKILAAPATATATAASVNSLGNVAVSVENLMALLGELGDEAIDPCFIMNKKFFYNKVLALKTTTNDPIFTFVKSGEKVVPALFGYPVYFDNSLTYDTTNSTAQVICGDLKGATVNYPVDKTIKFITDPYSLAEADKVKIVGSLLAGIEVTKDKYFAKANLTWGE